MQKLKCIGGLANGKIIEVANYYREHDQIRVMATIEFNLPTFEEDLNAYREGRTPDYMVIPYHFYKVAELQFLDKTKLRFLIPVDETVKNALCFVLGA
jgi:hypothetical protein